MLAHLANTHSKKLHKANHLLVAREHGGGYGTYGCSICLNKNFVTFVWCLPLQLWEVWWRSWVTTCQQWCRNWTSHATTCTCTLLAFGRYVNPCTRWGSSFQPLDIWYRYFIRAKSVVTPTYIYYVLKLLMTAWSQWKYSVTQTELFLPSHCP